MPPNPYPTGVLELVEKLQHSRIASIRSVVAGIIRIINDPGCGARDLREAIEIDPPLTAQVLKLANSAYYAQRVKILDIMQAIIFVGFDAIKELALNQKVAKAFRSPNENDLSIALWRHCVAVALTAKLIYRREFRQRGDNAYAAGILHDFGTIVLRQFTPAATAEVAALMDRETLELVEAETRILGFDHALLGQAITEAWDFPAELSEAIGGHHRPERAPGDPSQLASTLFVADHLARRRGFGDGCNLKSEADRFEESLIRLDLSPQAVDLIFGDVQIEIRRMQERGLLS